MPNIYTYRYVAMATSIITTIDEVIELDRYQSRIYIIQIDIHKVDIHY
jgi:hypothetical protein